MSYFPELIPSEETMKLDGGTLVGIPRLPICPRLNTPGFYLMRKEGLVSLVRVEQNGLLLRIIYENPLEDMPRALGMNYSEIVSSEEVTFWGPFSVEGR